MALIPQVDCKIEVYCELNPSEDIQKIKQAIFNVFDDDAELKTAGTSVRATFKKIESLNKMHQYIQSHKSGRVYWRFLNNNLQDDSTWFYLNKQAAFAGSIVLCENADESPLGPLKVVIHSKNISRIIEWLTL